MCFYFAGQYEKAVEQYRRAIAVEPKSHWSHLLLGWAYVQQGRFSEAIAELEEASRLIDRNPQVLAAIGHAYAKSGQRAAAQKVLAELAETAKRSTFRLTTSQPSMQAWATASKP
jgi:Flp pilus assembly protein TadD